MNRLFKRLSSIALCIGALTRLATADPISIDVFAAYAPSASPSLSPSWSSYVSNAIDALNSGSSQIGDRQVDPSAYETVDGAITPLEMFYTNFNSWRGLANPNPRYVELGSPLLAETGNRIHFGLHIQTDGTATFSLMDLTWALDSDDTTNFFDQVGDFSQSLYSSSRVGVHYGADGIRGTDDDIVFDGGELGIVPVHELMYVGVGEGFAALTGDGANNQESIANTVRALLAGAANTSFNLSGSYSLANPLGGDPLTASASVEIRIPAGMGGDFDFDKSISSADADLLTTHVVAETNDILFDLDLNERVDHVDLNILVHDMANTYFGDANFDGRFDSSDLINVLAAGLYETELPAVWSTGDFNVDGIFDSGDLITALADGGYEIEPPPVAAVPEPTALGLMVLGVALISLRSRRR